MKISPSIMCADLLSISEAVRAIEQAGVASVHVDILDGRFAPGFTFGAQFVRRLSEVTTLPLDVHLMSATPAEHSELFLSESIDSLTVHIEADCDPMSLLARIRKAGKRAGIAIKVETPISVIDDLYDHVDMIVIMAVSLGSTGEPQSVVATTKASHLVNKLKGRGFQETEIVLDGGVKFENLEAALDAGVHKVVSGSGIFRRDVTPQDAVRLFTERISEFEHRQVVTSRNARIDLQYTTKHGVLR